uniref:AHD domain-containing protein n=1 Tax=Macrostomum lignano TaxID=282301 RepID=A0A1I8JID7_9PLAT
VDRLPKTASLMKVVLKSSTPDSVREVTVFVADEDKPEKYVQVNRETPKEPKKALSPSQLENVEFPELPKLPKFVRVVLKTLPGKATSARRPRRDAQHRARQAGSRDRQPPRSSPSRCRRCQERQERQRQRRRLLQQQDGRPAVCLRKSVKLFESGELPSDALTNQGGEAPREEGVHTQGAKGGPAASGSGLPVKRGGSTQLTFPGGPWCSKSSTPDSVREVTVFVADEDKPEKYVQVNRETPKEPKKALSPSQLENVEFPELPKLPKFVRVVLKTLPGKATSVRAELKACHKPKTTDDTTDDDHDADAQHRARQAGKPGSPAAEKLTFPMPSMPGATGKTTTTPAPTTTTRRPAVCLRKSRRADQGGEAPREEGVHTPKERKEALLPSGSGLPVKRGGSTQLTFQVDRLPKTASLMKVVLKSSTPDSVRESDRNVEFPELPKLPKFVRVVLKTLPGKATSVRAELKACHKPKTT